MARHARHAGDPRPEVRVRHLPAYPRGLAGTVTCSCGWSAYVYGGRLSFGAEHSHHAQAAESLDNARERV